MVYYLVVYSNRGGFFMAKRRHKWDENTIKEFMKQGRGQGSGQGYIPWLNIRSLSSKGNSSRGSGWKTKRLHHFLSDKELNYFYMLEWEDQVTDIREQYPLLDLELAMDIAEKIGVRYPLVLGTPWVLTTDFFITLYDGKKEFNIARTVKSERELEDNRVLDKFEIERRYWLAKGVDWAVVTEQEIPKQLTQNVKWLHTHYHLNPTEELVIEELRYYANIIKRELLESTKPIRKVLGSVDESHNLDTGTALNLFRHLLARKEIVMDMNQKIYEGRSAEEILEILFEPNVEGKTV